MPFCHAVLSPTFDGVLVGTDWEFTNAPFPDNFAYGVIFSQNGQSSKMIKATVTVTEGTSGAGKVTPACYYFNGKQL